jgi:hypothetical protein
MPLAPYHPVGALLAIHRQIGGENEIRLQTGENKYVLGVPRGGGIQSTLLADWLYEKQISSARLATIRGV